MQTNQAFAQRHQLSAGCSGRIFHAIIPIFVAIFILGFGVSANAQSVTVDFAPGNGNQFISGFGGGLKHFSFEWGPLPQSVFDTLFGLDTTDTAKLGLGITRITVDPAGEDYYAPLNVAPYQDGWGWDAEASYGFQAEEEGAMVMASTPVPYCLQDGNPADCYTTTDEVGVDTPPIGTNPDAYLATSHYLDYGNWLKQYITYLEGLPNPLYLTGISLGDEPNNAQHAFGETYWTASEFDNWLADGDGAPISDADPRVRIMFPETVNFDSSLADTALRDSSASQYVGIVNGHCYDGGQQNPPAIDPYATSLGIPEWMTECGDLQGPDHVQTWGDAVNLALSVAAWMNAKYKAYIWFNAIDSGDEFLNGFPFDNGFVNYADCDATACTNAIEPEGAAMGQYSEWVRPGYQVVTSSSSDPGGPTLAVSAYQGKGNFVIVVVNSSQTTAVSNVTFSVGGLTALTSSEFNVYQSNSNGGGGGTTCGTGVSNITCLKSEGTVTATLSGSNYTFSYTLPKSSVVTFVGSGTSELEMLANRDWATGDLAGWKVFVGSGSASDVTVPRDTSLSGDFYALKEYDANNSFNVNANQTIKNQPPGDDYTFSAYAKTDGSNTHGYLEVINPTIGTICQKNISNVIAWTQYTCSGTVPSSGSLQLVLGTSGASPGQWIEFGGVTLSVTPP